tara:strand:- start:415 stop:762 length:348 start_codon:yes stop_codon:yes gene_type:complete
MATKPYVTNVTLLRQQMNEKFLKRGRQMSNNYKGYALFLDVEDKQQRINNQAKVLANIFEDNLDKTGVLKGKGCSDKGAELIIGYANQLKEYDKAAIAIIYKKLMNKRGFKEVTQ